MTTRECTPKQAVDLVFKRAADLAKTRPAQAFDLVLAAENHVAAKDPEVVTLNRALRGIKTEAVKYLGKEIPDLVWHAGDTFDYIGLGSAFMLIGAAEENGPSSIRIEINITKPNAQYDKPGEYGVTSITKGKGNRQIEGDRVPLTLDDMKKAAKWLGKAVKAIERHLKGSLDAEKEEILSAVAEAEEVYKEIGPALEKLRPLIEKSTNLLADADEIRAAVVNVPDHNIQYPLERIRNLIDRIKQAGG